MNTVTILHLQLRARQYFLNAMVMVSETSSIIQETLARIDEFRD